MSNYKDALKDAYRHLDNAHDELEDAEYECSDEALLSDLSDAMCDIMEAMQKVKALYNKEELNG